MPKKHNKIYDISIRHNKKKSYMINVQDIRLYNVYTMIFKELIALMYLLDIAGL